jgi:hypothetical protein
MCYFRTTQESNKTRKTKSLRSSLSPRIFSWLPHVHVFAFLFLSSPISLARFLLLQERMQQEIEDDLVRLGNVVS